MPVVFGQTQWQLNYQPEECLISSCPLGSTAPNGGLIICKNGLGVAWIVAPNTSEVSRDWNNRNDAVTTATACTSATGWFVPSRPELQSPGYSCRNYWDSYCATYYWSSTEVNSGACIVSLANGSALYVFNKGSIRFVRAFRCVTY